MTQKREGPQHMHHQWIHNIKGRTYVKVLISNFTYKHITFNKGGCVGHLEPPIEDVQQIWEDSGSLTSHSITMKKMMAEKAEPDTFEPPSHKLRKDTKTKLEELLMECKSHSHKMRQPLE